MITALPTGAELTRRAAEAWAWAVDSERYDVRLVHADDKCRVERRQPGLQGLLRLLPMPRARNSEDRHVYARPIDTAVVLVDDLGEDGLHDMHIAGDRPVAIVATSPYNYQAWIRLAPRGAGPSHEVATQVAAQLARSFGGDPGAAHSRQLGRLHGLRNRKGAYERGDGSFPVVTLHSPSREVDPATSTSCGPPRASSRCAGTTGPSPGRPLPSPCRPSRRGMPPGSTGRASRPSWRSFRPAHDWIARALTTPSLFDCSPAVPCPTRFARCWCTATRLGISAGRLVFATSSGRLPRHAPRMPRAGLITAGGSPERDEERGSAGVATPGSNGADPATG